MVFCGADPSDCSAGTGTEQGSQVDSEEALAMLGRRRGEPMFRPESPDLEIE